MAAPAYTVLVRRSDDLETPDFDGRPFPVPESQDDWPSRSHGWALVLVLIFAIVGFYSLRGGSTLGGIVFLALAAGVFALAAVAIRGELRKFMEYRRRV